MDVEHRRWAVGVFLLIAAFTGCGLGPQVEGSGRWVEEERQTPDFVALVVENGIDVQVVVDEGQPRTVRLVGDDNLVAMMRTEMWGANTLRVFLRPEEVQTWTSSNPLRVEVTVPKLEGFVHSGGGTADLSGSISPASFSLVVSGEGTARVRGLIVGALRVEASGSSSVQVEGEAHQVTSTVSGGSTLTAAAFFCRDASIFASGSSNVMMKVLESLRVTASGLSSVHVVGQPEILSQDVSTGAKLVLN